MLATRSTSLSRLTKSLYNTSPRRFSSVWGKVEKGPEDPILGITVAFNKDPAPIKINLGVGAYRDDKGKPYILQCVRKAEKQIFEQNMDHEYTTIGGVPSFVKLVQELQLGASHPALKEKRVVTVQALSGTGALRVGADFMRRHIDLPGENKKRIYLPNPTWGNHIPLYKDAGFEVKYYAYYNEKNCGLDFDGLVRDVEAAPNNSLFLFHACAHNPTGVDPNMDQWKKLSQLCKKKGHFTFFDLAYQGFASGDPQRDVRPVLTFIDDGHNVGISQSFAKNFGLYGERIGALTFLTQNAKEADAVESQLKILIRPMYSNPPVYGARVISTILSSPELTSQWKEEVKLMANRIIGMRQSLVDQLKKFGSKRDWSHITKQIGMFCYSGLTPEQVDRLASEFHVYLTRNGRISIAGITPGNVEHLAKSIHEVTK
jgi:aspartate aminotransferase